MHVLKHFPWCIVAAPPLPFVRINMTVKRSCPKGFNWCWHTWSTNIKLWLRAEMATNSGSNTIVEQTSATNNRCLRTAPILRRILGGSLPCDILRCFQQIAFRKTNANNQLVYTTYSCCISMVRRLTHVHSQIFASFCMRPSPLKPSTDDLFWRGIWCPASHATGWSTFLRQFFPLRSHAPSQFIGLMSNDQPCEFEWHCLFIPCSFRNLNKLPVFSWKHGLYDCSILAYLRIP